MVASRVRSGPMLCGFCQSGNHNHCPRAVRNGDGRIIPCKCTAPFCGDQVLRCLDCKNENEGEVSPDGWRCLDREACGLEVQRRLDVNPHVQTVREVMRRVTENATTEKTAKAERAPKKETFCLHCGEQTGGGLFRPGHDAKFVSEKVKQIVFPEQGETAPTADAVLTDMKERGMSEALQTKFKKSVELARKDKERREGLAAEAKAKADAKAKEDAEKAAAKSAKGAEPEVVTPDTDPEKAGDPDAKPGKARKLASK